MKVMSGLDKIHDTLKQERVMDNINLLFNKIDELQQRIDDLLIQRDHLLECVQFCHDLGVDTATVCLEEYEKMFKDIDS